MTEKREDNLTLADLQTGEEGVIVKVKGHGSFRKRITEMGFVSGKNVKVIKNAPLKDPVEYRLMGYNISLRRSEASLIEVIPSESGYVHVQSPYSGTLSEDRLYSAVRERTKTINVALVGNPNSGKTTLFNHASGSHQRVGNYGGVTVESKEASVRQDGYTIKLVDLPGTYSITEYTPEELFVRNHLLNESPDVVVNVIDASNLERNMFLTTQLIDMNIKVIIALNMYDELKEKNIELNHTELGRLLGIPVIPTVAVRGFGITELMKRIIVVYEEADPDARHIHINYGNTIEESIARIQAEIKKNSDAAARYSTRYLSVKLLEDDRSTLDLLREGDNFEAVTRVQQAEIQSLEKEYGVKSGTVIADAKYGFIAGALNETCKGCSVDKPGKGRNIDSVLTHRIWGFPVFLAFMWLMFQTTFTLGGYPMDWIEAGVGWIGGLIGSTMPEGSLRDLLTDGIIGGVGGVIVFLPNILILFFFISLMEDTGYMARVSFIMDKLMHKVGLHGKSFIPLLMGFGCNVPAVMATRTLDNRKDRIITMLIIPFMSCSARLPVYILIISAFFPSYQGLVLFSVYLLGIAMAVIMAKLLRSTVFSKQDVPFVMELPPYRIPTIRNTLRHMWFKGSQYLRKMGTVILVASVIIWALGYFPRKVNYSADYDSLIASVSSDNSLTEERRNDLVDSLTIRKTSEHQEKSVIGRLGRFIEPAILPLGFDWKIGVSILTGMAAKEIVVGTMGILYHADAGSGKGIAGLTEKLQLQVHTRGKLEGERVFTPVVAYGFMLFILIYFPCVAVIAAIRKEAGWGWAFFAMFYTTAIAWVVAFIVYQGGRLFI